MKLFKSIDDKFKEIGFIKIDEDEYGVLYRREEVKYNYAHCIEIIHKLSGRHIVISYQKDINNEGFNNAVGLTVYETKLVLKKIKKMGLM